MKELQDLKKQMERLEELYQEKAKYGNSVWGPRNQTGSEAVSLCLEMVKKQISVLEEQEIAPKTCYEDLVRECLEDMSGKSASEASNAEWEYAKKELGRWLAERITCPNMKVK